MATSTSGGTTASLSNTPQAKDDFYTAGEDQVLYFCVMDNDLGGAAKVLWSIDNTSDDGSGDLVAKDVAGVCEYSELGAKISLTSDGRIKYDTTLLDSLAAGQTVIDQFTYAIRLSNGTLSWATVTVTLTGSNDGPVAVADTASVEEDSSTSGTVAINDSDVDSGAILSYALDNPSSAPTGLVFNPDGSWTFDASSYDSLAEGEQLELVIPYTVTDEHGATSSSTLTITVIGTNDGPVANSDSDTTSENAVLLVDVLANDTDVDDGHSLTVVSASAPAGQGSVSVVSNQVEFDPGTDFDHLAEGDSVTVTVSYTIKDEYGASSSSTIDILVTGTNDGPVANPDTGSAGENENKAFAVVTNDTDVDGSAVLTLASIDGVTVDGNPATLDEEGAFSIVGSSIQFTPGSAFDHLAEGDSATVVVTYTITDEHGATSSSTLTITVTGTNDGPNANADSDTTTENATLLVDVLANDTDVDDGHVLTVTEASAPAGQGSASVVGNQVEFDPGTDFDHLAEGDSVTVTVSYTIEDEYGASSSSTIDILVTGTNDTPALSASLTDHGYVDTSADDSFGAVSGTLSTNDPDDGDTATYSVSGGVADNSRPGFDTSSSSAYGTLYLDSATGAYEFVPDDGAIEGLKSDDSVGFTLTVTDSLGASDSETLTINLDGANDTPEAPSTNSVTTDEDNASSATAIGASDRDDGEILTYSVKTGEEPEHGSVSFDQTAGTFVYTPDANYHGSDSFTILVTDASGATTEQTVDVTVNSVNDLPEAAGTNSVTTDEDNASGAVAIGASDVDGDALSYSIKSGGEPAHGSVSFDQVAGSFVYTPDANYYGDDSFTILVDDGNGGTAEQIVSVTVNAVNDAPVSANGSSSTDEDTPLNGSLPAASDVDGDSVTYALDTDAANGTAVVNADGSFSYTPDPDFNGADSFSFTVSDGNGGSNSYTYDVTVSPVNDAAVVTGDDSGTVVEDAVPNSVSGDLDSTDVDNDDDSWNAVVAPAASANGYGTYTIDAAGNWTYALDNSNPVVDALNVGDPLADSFTVYTQDSTAQIVTITIEGTNDLPSVSGDLLGEVTEAGMSNGGGDPTATGTAIVEDVDNPDVFVPNSGASDLGYGTFSIDADGNWTYTLDNDNPAVKDLNDGDTLEDHFQIYSDDGTPTQVTITINGANDAIILPPVYNGDDDPNNFDLKNEQDSGTNLITGTIGNDLALNGNNSANTIRALSGDDTVNAGGGGDTVYGGSGADTINGGAGNDFLYGQAGDDVIHGDGNNDAIYGGSGNDQIFGDDNSDQTLYGGSGNDTISGGDNNDRLVGGFGADELTGGANSDTFAFLDVRDTGDTITDYTPGPDTLDFSAIDANPFAVGNQVFEWGGTDATAFGIWFAQVGSDTVLYADTDGDASTAEFVLTLDNFSGFAAYGEPESPPPMSWVLL